MFNKKCCNAVNLDCFSTEKSEKYMKKKHIKNEFDLHVMLPVKKAPGNMFYAILFSQITSMILMSTSCALICYDFILCPRDFHHF